jgi:hypothetical protein
MRKLLTALLLVSAIGNGPTARAATKSQKDTPSIRALKGQVEAFEKAITEELQKASPNKDRLLSFVYRPALPRWNKTFDELIADPSRLVEIREVPVDIKRIISIKKQSKTRVLVDSCFVNSLRFVLPTQTIPDDRSAIRLDGARTIQDWRLSKGNWRVNTRDAIENYTEESGCLNAR